MRTIVTLVWCAYFKEEGIQWGSQYTWNKNPNFRIHFCITYFFNINRDLIWHSNKPCKLKIFSLVLSFVKRHKREIARTRQIGIWANNKKLFLCLFLVQIQKKRALMYHHSPFLTKKGFKLALLFEFSFMLKRGSYSSPRSWSPSVYCLE